MQMVTQHSTATPVVAVIGCSGCGKSSLAERLQELGVARRCLTWATRPPRADETRGGADHVFVSDGEFDALQAAGRFAAVGRLQGLPFRYGLPAPQRDGVPVLVVLRAAHVPALRVIVPALVVYQLVSPLETVRARVAARALPVAEQRIRLDGYAAEMVAGRRVADRVFVNSGSLGDLAARVAAALRADVARAVLGGAA